MNSKSEVKLPKYVLELLNTILIDEGFTESTITSVPGSNYADGVTSDLLRISINGFKKSEPNVMQLIVKIPPENETRRRVLKSDLNFEREIFIYKEFLPAIETFQKDKGLTFKNGFFSFPKCYGSISDANSNTYCLILEDLKESGLKMWNKLIEMDLEHVETVIKQYARLHAVSFALRDQKLEIFEKFHHMPNTMMPVMEQSDIIMALQMTFDIAIASLNSDEKEALSKMEKLKTNYLEELRFCLTQENSRPYTVVAHGDSWSNNMLFGYTNTNELNKVCLIDWQMTRATSPVLDFLYFFFTSTHTSLRHSHYDTIQKTYYNTLADTIRLLGSNPEQLFTFTNFQDELKKFGKFSVLMGVMLLQSITTESSDIPNLDKLAENLGDPEKMDRSLLSSRSQERYNKRMSNLIRDAIALGYL